MVERKKKPDIKKDQSTEQKILAAAKQAFLEKGMSGARMQDIADAAGINKALLHYYFRNKEKLFDVIFREAAGQFFPLVNSIFESPVPLFEKIGMFCRAYIDKMLQNPYLPLFVLNEVNKQPHLFIQRMWGGQTPQIGKFIAQVEEEIKKGTIRPVGSAHLLMNMLSMCIFPFIGKPLWQIASGMDELQFRYMMEQRKTAVPEFIIASIKK